MIIEKVNGDLDLFRKKLQSYVERVLRFQHKKEKITSDFCDALEKELTEKLLHSNQFVKDFQAFKREGKAFILEATIIVSSDLLDAFKLCVDSWYESLEKDFKLKIRCICR